MKPNSPQSRFQVGSDSLALPNSLVLSAAMAWLNAGCSAGSMRALVCLGRFDMAAEPKAHGREQFFAEGVAHPRTEAGIERGRQHLGRHRLLDRRLDGPAALTGIGDVAGELGEL